ncbi:hypothetical protein LAHI110946_12500 [Lactococcus hircilactis]
MFFKTLTYSQKIVLGFILLGMLGTFLLTLPIWFCCKVSILSTKVPFLYFDYAGIPIKTLISVDTEKPKSVPFLRFFLYMPLIVFQI